MKPEDKVAVGSFVPLFDKEEAIKLLKEGRKREAELMLAETSNALIKAAESMKKLWVQLAWTEDSIEQVIQALEGDEEEEK